MTLEKLLAPMKERDAADMNAKTPVTYAYVERALEDRRVLIAKAEALGRAAVIGEMVCSTILHATKWELSPSLRGWIAENAEIIRAALGEK